MRAWLAVALVAALAPGCKRTQAHGEQAAPAPRGLHVEDAPVFPALQAADITRLVIDQPGAKQVILAQAGAHWRLEAPIRDAADDRAIFYALQELDRMEWAKAPLPSGEATAAARGATDADLLTLQITQSGTALPPLHLGKKGVARVGARRDLYEVYHANYYTFAREVRFWRDRTVSRVAPGDITGLEVRDDAGKAIVIARGGSADAPTFTLTEQTGVKGALDSAAAEQLYRHVVNLQADDVAAISPADAGLATPRLHLVVRAASGATDIAFGAATPDGGVYVQVGDSPRVLRLNKSAASLIARAPGTWLR